MRMVLAAALVLGGYALSPGEDGNVRDLEAQKALIKPRAQETQWEEIPWEVDLWDARRKAARQGKPILLWEMDGNPMGCG